jgi:hypothetical protein
LDKDPNVIRNKMPVVGTFRAQATQATQQRRLASRAVSMGRQRLELPTLHNHPLYPAFNSRDSHWQN